MNTALVADAELRAKRTLDRRSYERYLPLVRRTAMRFARRVPSSITVSDLVGYGWLGLMEAFQRSSPDMPEEEFEAYALYRVRGAMLDYLRSLDPTTRALRRTSRRIAQAMKTLSARLGREAEEREIAAELGVDVEEYRRQLEGVGVAGLARLEVLDLDDLDVASAGATAEDDAARQQLVDLLAEGIQRLPTRLGQVLALYYQEDCTLKQIGEVLGVSESRACQLHTEAVHRLRAAVGRE